MTDNIDINGTGTEPSSADSAEFAFVRRILNEKQFRQFVAYRAMQSHNILRTATAAHVARNTVRKGIAEIQTGDVYVPSDRVRKVGAGPKRLQDTDEGLLRDLEEILEPKGDPMSLLRWTTKSLSNLVEALSERGHQIKKSALAVMLKGMGFSLKANKKNIEGTSHVDRDPQFRHIKESCQTFEKEGDPIISVDCKKKELIGNFKNGGREWQAKGTNQTVNVYDFMSIADGKALPYGVYDTVKNLGFVNVGVSHDTASFAVESIRRWWQHVGADLYLGRTKLLITSDGGGSNGVRCGLWKKELQELADETGLSITVNHLPPATSKWNMIEHRLFSYISLNWRARPLISLETVIELISHTSTRPGLKVTAVLDQNEYPTGIRVTEEELHQLNIARDEFHPEWNYTISPHVADDP